jgi:aldehyde:ferredoxin oxidoreductase
VLYGRAPAWTMLVIRAGEVEFRDALPYLGMDNIDMRDAVQRDLGGVWKRNLSMVNITRAGENLVLTSGIMGGPKAIYARGGPGAKMGALQLKAIVTLSPTRELPSRRSCSARRSSRMRCRSPARPFSTSPAACWAPWGPRTIRRRPGPTRSMRIISIPIGRAWRAASAVP